MQECIIGLGLLVAIVLALNGYIMLRLSRRLRVVEHRLAWSETSLYGLEEQVHAAGAVSKSLAAAMNERRGMTAGLREFFYRRGAAEAGSEDGVAPATRNASRARGSRWSETQPFGPSGFRYANTVPGDLTA